MEVVKVEIVDGAVNEKEKVEDGEAIWYEEGSDFGYEDDRESGDETNTAVAADDNDESLL